MPLSCLFYAIIRFLQYIAETGIKVRRNATVTSISENSVSFRDQDGNVETIPAKTVVSAFGYKAYNPLEEIAKKYCDHVNVIGCAVKAGNALTAIREGYEAALAL